MPQTIIENCTNKMEKALEGLANKLNQLKTGVANPSILNNVKVSYYGSDMPLNNVAAIAVPEPQMLTIKPFDRSILNDILKAIQLADLNLTPVSDGTMIRINFPPLTQETRKETAKKVKTIGEEIKVGIRNARREAIDELKELEKESLITEDELKRYSDDVQKLTDKYIAKVDAIVKEKEESLLKM